MEKKISTVLFYPHTELATGKYIVEVCFRNEITGREYWRVYKSKAAAKAQATKFHKSMARIYG